MAVKGSRKEDENDPVEEASEESFPASDPPAWAMGTEHHGSEGAVINNPAQSRFELTVGGRTAYLTYRLQPPLIAIVHTEVPSGFEGQGAGGKLARAALEFARREKLQVRPLCPFVAEYMRRHPEFADLARPAPAAKP